MVSQRLAGVPMETQRHRRRPGRARRRPHRAGSPTRRPTPPTPALAPALGLEPEQLRVVCPWVGGGFGPKAAMYVEYIIAGDAALALSRPVKWTETRSEDMVSLVHGRDFEMKAKLGLKNDGTIVGLESDVVASAGAYPAIGAILPMLTQMMSVGVYDIPKVRFDASTAITNNTTIGAYRGAGRPEATQLIERVIDVAADQLGIDPAEIRRKNFLKPANFPMTTTTGANYDSGEYAKALDAALAASGYDELRAEQARRRAANDPKLLGIGISAYVEVTAPVGLHVEFGAVEVHDDGTASMFVGTSVHGQGHQTAFAMLASDVLGIPMEKLKLVNSDTATVPRGAGTHGLPVAADRRQRRARGVHRGARPRPSRSPPTCSRPAPTTSSSASRAWRWRACPPKGRRRGASCRPRLEGRLQAARRRRGRAAAPRARLRRHRLHLPFGAHVSVVEVDTETGKVTMLRHIAVDDCGRILNPLLVRGQQHGGIAQGAAQALFEEICTTTTATRSRRTWPTTPCRRRPSCPASRRQQHPDRQPPQPARGQGHRRVGHHRLHPGDPERRRRRRVPPRREAHRHAVHGRAGLAGHPGRRQRRLALTPRARTTATP